MNKVLRPHVLHLPTLEKKLENAAKIEEKYHLPGFFAGIDGTFLCFDGKPRYADLIQHKYS